MHVQAIKKIEDWYRKNARKLPWRTNRDPYLIWVSEVILQQTQVKQGLPYFQRFTGIFPDVKSLAQAPRDDVLKLWQGLGYYSRAHKMIDCARIIHKQFNGQFPKNQNVLLGLPGIGPYTAAAILSIAYAQPYAVVDGNVIRVLSRLYGIRESVSRGATLKEIRKRAQLFMEGSVGLGIDPGDWNQALMEFGALQCRPMAPLCSTCPVHKLCRAHELGLTNLIPFKDNRPKVLHRRLDFVLAVEKGKFGIRKRGKGDIWAGLWQLPLLKRSNIPEESGNLVELWHIRHRLSHRDLELCFWQADDNGVGWEGNGELHWISASEKGNYAFPVPLLKFLERAEMQGWI